jgi:hypothetical protein
MVVVVVGRRALRAISAGTQLRVSHDLHGLSESSAWPHLPRDAPPPPPTGSNSDYHCEKLMDAYIHHSVLGYRL